MFSSSNRTTGKKILLKQPVNKIIGSEGERYFVGIAKVKRLIYQIAFVTITNYIHPIKPETCQYLTAKSITEPYTQSVHILVG